MEEDLEILEDNIDMFMDTLYENYRQYKVKPFEKAIEHLISAYKKLEEENKDLKSNQCVYKDTSSCVKSLSFETYTKLADYIPKSVIEEKIKWLDDMTKDETKQFCYVNYRYTRNILEEFLKKGDNNVEKEYGD